MKNNFTDTELKRPRVQMTVKHGTDVGLKAIKPRGYDAVVRGKPSSVVAIPPAKAERPVKKYFIPADEPDEPRSAIQWPTDIQLRLASKQLMAIKAAGVDCERNGDYFNSGDLAYQLQENLRAILDLFRKCERIRIAKEI